MRSFALSALAVLALAALVSRAAAEEVRFTLLHTTDVHGSLLPWDDLAQKPAARGLARAATLVARVRAEGPPVVLLDDGDATSGSPLTSVWHKDHAGAPEPVTMVMNAMGYDAMAVGNHEFDFGPAALESTRAAARFPFLAANIVRADGSPAFQASLVKQLPNGLRVGVIGLCTPAVPQLADPAQVAGYTFLSPIEVAQKEVARLRNSEYCDVVIALAHTGLEKDPRTGELRKGDAPGEDFGWRLAHEVRGLDVVILGHTHVVVPYAYADEGGALIVQAGKSAENVGRVDVSLRRDSPGQPWTVANRRSYVLALGDTVSADTALAARLAPYEARTKAALDEVVGTASGEFSAPGGRFSDNVLLQLVHRAQLAATGADISLAALFDPAQVIAAGPVRVRDLMRLYPYENSLVTVEMTGADVRAALEHSAEYLAAYTFEDGRPLAEPGMPGFNFDMAMGVEYQVDLSRPVGQRVVSLSRIGRPLEETRLYKVAVNGYRAAGGGDFTMIRRANRVGTANVTAPEAVIAFVRALRTIAPEMIPEWTLLPGYAATPERPLIDRLVRTGVLPRDEATQLDAGAPATRGDLDRWLALALGRTPKQPAPKPAPAFERAPEAKNEGEEAEHERERERAAARARAGTKEAQPISPATAIEALRLAARSLKLASGPAGDPAFGLGLLTGTSLAPRAGTEAVRAPAASLTRAQLLGMIANLRFPQVRVLETTDFHGAILGGSKERRSGRPIGSTPALAALVAHLRAENPQGTVLLDGGDIFQGTMISNLQFGRPVVEQMDLLEYAAGAIGNHDFDWSADTLKARVMGMRFAALGANIIERSSGRRPWWVRSDTTFVRRGVRVSVFGLGYPGTPRVTLPANVAHLKFEDDSTTAARIVPRLRRAGADVILEVGHIPAETDSSRKARGDLLRLAHVPGVDAWLGGHSHNVVDDVVNGAPVMIGGANGQWLAICDLTVDALKHQVTESHHRVAQIFADEYPLDSVWVARVQSWNAGVAPIAAAVLGRNAVALNRRRPEATIGDFITDAMRFQSGADIAMQNPGGMRADLAAGEVTRGAIYEVMPFDNTIVTLELTGADVKRALEQALRYERITQVSGIRYEFDTNQPAMSRVTSLTLADGSALDPAKTFKVAVNNFMATGGDNYDALNRGARGDGGLVIRGALEAYVRDKCKAGGALEIREDGRIQQAGR
jgi:2',3'-cyclic-nucleotide 2'-phosphodiesterase/3'-nucleotidase